MPMYGAKKAMDSLVHPTNGLPCNYVYVKALVGGHYLSTLANSTLIILFSMPCKIVQV
jgi:hypothetical protein